MNKRIQNKKLNLTIYHAVTPYLKYIKRNYGLINLSHMQSWRQHEITNHQTRFKLNHVHGYYFEIKKYPDFKFFITKFLNGAVYLYIDPLLSFEFTRYDDAYVFEKINDVEEFDNLLFLALKKYKTNDLLEDKTNHITNVINLGKARIEILRYLQELVESKKIYSAQVIHKYYENKISIDESNPYQLNIIIDTEIDGNNQEKCFKITNKIWHKIYDIYQKYHIYTNEIDYDQSYFKKHKTLFKEEYRDIKHSLFYIDEFGIVGMYRKLLRK